MTTDFKDIMSQLINAPDSQIDENIKVMVKKLLLANTIKSDDVLAILDACAYTAGASDFVMTLLDIIWHTMLEEEGLTVEEAFKNAEARRFNYENS